MSIIPGSHTIIVGMYTVVYETHTIAVGTYRLVYDSSLCATINCCVGIFPICGIQSDQCIGFSRMCGIFPHVSDSLSFQRFLVPIPSQWVCRQWNMISCHNCCLNSNPQWQMQIHGKTVKGFLFPVYSLVNVAKVVHHPQKKKCHLDPIHKNIKRFTVGFFFDLPLPTKGY